MVGPGEIHGEMLDVQIWAKLSEVTSCYLGVSSLGIGRVQTLERQQAGVKWWN